MFGKNLTFLFGEKKENFFNLKQNKQQKKRVNSKNCSTLSLETGEDKINETKKGAGFFVCLKLFSVILVALTTIPKKKNIIYEEHFGTIEDNCFRFGSGQFGSRSAKTLIFFGIDRFSLSPLLLNCGFFLPHIFPPSNFTLIN